MTVTPAVTKENIEKYLPKWLTSDPSSRKVCDFLEEHCDKLFFKNGCVTQVGQGPRTWTWMRWQRNEQDTVIGIIFTQITEPVKGAEEDTGMFHIWKNPESVQEDEPYAITWFSRRTMIDKRMRNDRTFFSSAILSWVDRKEPRVYRERCILTKPFEFSPDLLEKIKQVCGKSRPGLSKDLEEKLYPIKAKPLTQQAGSGSGGSSRPMAVVGVVALAAGGLFVYNYLQGQGDLPIVPPVGPPVAPVFATVASNVSSEMTEAATSFDFSRLQPW